MNFESWWDHEAETITVFAFVPDEKRKMTKELMRRSWDEAKNQERISYDKSDACDCQFVDDGFCPHLKVGAACKFKTDYKEAKDL